MIDESPSKVCMFLRVMNSVRRSIFLYDKPGFFYKKVMINLLISINIRFHFGSKETKNPIIYENS